MGLFNKKKSDLDLALENPEMLEYKKADNLYYSEKTKKWLVVGPLKKVSNLYNFSDIVSFEVSKDFGPNRPGAYTNLTINITVKNQIDPVKLLVCMGKGKVQPNSMLDKANMMLIETLQGKLKGMQSII